MLHTMIFSSLPYADLHRPHTLRAFYNLLRKRPFFSFYYSFPVFTSTYLTRIYKSVTGRVINETIPSGKGKSRKNNNVYTEFKYFQRTLSSFILDSIAVYTTYHLMSQIKVKELTSLLLSIRTLNTLCAPARAFHLEQGEEISVIFFPFRPCRYVDFFIIHASMLLMPLLAPKTSVHCSQLLECNDTNPCW